MWYVLPDSNKQYPVPIERVKEIRLLNVKGQRPDELGAVELSPAKAEDKEMGHVELVGQISLKTLEKNSRRRKDKQQGQQRNQQGGQQGNQQRKPQQQQGSGNNKQSGSNQNRGNQQRPQQQRPQQQRPQQNRPPLEIKKQPPKNDGKE
jgi:hypothetical protein